MDMIQATKETGPLYHVAWDEDKVLAIGITNPGEITISGFALVSDADETRLHDKLADAMIISVIEAVQKITIEKDKLIDTPWVRGVDPPLKVI